ncbi:MAG: hypothetical protein Q9191_003542, partial [Dirinaria sp. TL-2023a]
ENPLPPVRAPKSSAPQKAAHGRQRDRDGGERAGEAGAIEPARGTVEGRDAARGGDADEG